MKMEIQNLGNIFQASKAQNEKELVAKTNLYFELLDGIPTDRLKDVFKEAMTKESYFPKPFTLLRLWEEIKASMTAWRDNEQKRLMNQDVSQNPNDYPTQDQHEAAIKLIVHVACDRKMSAEEGHKLLAEIMA